MQTTGVTTNDEQRLFCIPAVKGFSCLGYDVARARTADYAATMGRHDLAPQAAVGSLAAYTEYLVAEDAYIKWSAGRNFTTFSPNTPERVNTALEGARTKRERIRFWYGDSATGQSWHDEHDVMGYVGRSLGPIRMPLILDTDRSSGGPAILTNCIIRIVRTTDHTELYRHPTFNAGTWSVAESDMAGYAEMALVDGKLHARFKKRGQAAPYCAFMKGERFSH